MKFSDFNLSKNSDGLLPVIVQDDTTLKVLMLGYMNEEAFDRSLELGRVTFFSRTRGQLWTKGETSGNYLNIVSMQVDCDSDTLLVRADPVGPTCHRGTTSCFDSTSDSPSDSSAPSASDDEGFIRTLAKVIRGRHEQMPEGSYTTKLFIKGPKVIGKKVGEECTEAVIEAVSGNRERFIYEASDLVYHTLVLMEAMGVSISDLESELRLRHS